MSSRPCALRSASNAVMRVRYRILVMLLLALAGCGREPGAGTAQSTPTQPAAAHFSGERAYQHVEAQLQWVPRDTGTPGWQATGDYLIAQLKAAGWQVEEQRFPLQGQAAEGRNIVAKRGDGPLIILGAHYDTRRVADHDPNPANHTKPVPGAVDGASGVAVLLELAHVLAQHELSSEVWLVFFDAEDNGNLEGWDWILGSTYFANNLNREPQAAVIVDMVGQRDQRIPIEPTSSQELQQEIWAVAQDVGATNFTTETGTALLDDHTPFLERGWQAVDIIDFDYPQWHTIDDTLEQVSPTSLEEVGRVLEHWILSK